MSKPLQAPEDAGQGVCWPAAAQVFGSIPTAEPWGHSQQSTVMVLRLLLMIMKTSVTQPGLKQQEAWHFAEGTTHPLVATMAHRCHLQLHSVVASPLTHHSASPSHLQGPPGYTASAGVGQLRHAAHLLRQTAGM